jgi:hypothetical protein
MRAALWFIVLGLALLACVVVSGCGASRTVVASVAGAPVDSKLLDDWTRAEIAAGAAHNRTEAKRQALGLLIRWLWTEGDARAMHVSVTPGEVEKELTLVRANLGDSARFEFFPGERFIKPFLQSPDVPQAEQSMLVRMALLALRVVQHETASAAARVPRAAVLSYYRSHTAEFWVRERRDIKAIMNWHKPSILKAKRELQAGTPFHAVEEHFNQSEEGGLRLGRAPGSQIKQYEKDYFSAPAHVLIGPRKELMYYVFEVVSIKPAHKRALAQVERLIRRHLAAPYAAAARRAAERRWQTKTVCVAGYQTSACGGYSAHIH